METIVVRPATEGFATLLRQVRAAGLMDRRRGYYLAKIGLTAAVLVAGWAGLFVVGDSWVTLVVAAVLGFVGAQVVFLGHDAGHHQIVTSRRGNRLIGLTAGNLATGLSFGWWVPKHVAHHAHPNTENRDPDIGDGVIAWTPAQAQRRSGLSRWAARHQAGLFFPLLPLEGVSLHRASLQSLRLRRKERSAQVEMLLILVHAGLYLTAAFWVLSPERAIAFIAVQQGVFGGYLGCAFAPNHTGMPIIDEDGGQGFARTQILTSRNIGGGPLMTFFLGGLDLQIEHHLFPGMPDRWYGRSAPATAWSTGRTRSWVRIVRSSGTCARPARAGPEHRSGARCCDH
jgi:fatty acid desaturase